MIERTFVFDPNIYRISNRATWRRLQQLDGTVVEVLGPPDERGVNRVKGKMPDGLIIELEVFNRELQPNPPA